MFLLYTKLFIEVPLEFLKQVKSNDIDITLELFYEETE